MVQTVHAFAEKVVLISDAGDSIGRAVAIQLALQGAFVVGLFQNGEKSRLDELVELGTLANAFDLDPSTTEGARAAAGEVNRIFGRLDLLVNCLKYDPEWSFETLTGSDFVRMANSNLGSVCFLTQAVTDLMRSRPRPKIVNVTTSASPDPIFAATQSGVREFTASLARELPDNFRINCVAIDRSETKAPVASDDIARIIVFLLSSESVGLNGQTITIG